jgi:tetratricopeptide (TPR) repeat protein
LTWLSKNIMLLNVYQSNFRQSFIWQRAVIKARLNLALNYLREKKRDEARREFEKILSCKLDESVLSIIHYYFGSILKKNGFLLQSKRKFNEVIRISAEKDLRSGAHFHLGEIYLAMRKVGKAKEEFLKCIKINPEHNAAQKKLSGSLKNKPQDSFYKKVVAC